MVDVIKKIDEKVASIEGGILVFLFIFMLGLMLLQVFCRYFLKMPLGWSEEASRYLYIMTTFIGGAIAIHEREHIEINFIKSFVNKFEEKEKKKTVIKVLNTFQGLVICCFLSILVWQFFLLVRDQIGYHMVSTAMQIPVSIVTGTMLVCLILMVIHQAVLTFLNLNNTGLTGYEEYEEDDNKEETTCC